MAETKKINATVDLVKSGVEFKLNGGTILSDDGTSHYLHSQSNLYLYSGSSNTMVLTSSGNVGIGTTSPGTKLEVSSSGAEGVLISKDTGNTSNSGRLFFETDTVSEGFSFLNSNGLMTIRSQAQAGTTSGNVRVTINGSGNVGIGTTSPNRNLHVIGQIALDNSASAPSAGMLISSDSASNKIYSRTANNNSAALAFEIISGASSSLYIKADGNVGIGTTNPSTSLHVVRDASWEVARFEADSYPTATVYSQAAAKYAQLNIYDTRINSEPTMELRADTPHFNIRLDDTGNVLTIRDGGNVGIGTTSPGYKLSVNGDIQIPQNEYIYFDNSAHYIRRGSSDVEIQGYNGLQLRTGGSSRLYINQSGNVGIGTTSPSEKLDVAGNIQVNGNNILFDEGTNEQSAIISSANYLEIKGNYSTPSDGARIWVGKGDTVDSGFYVNASQHFFRGLDSSAKMYINGTSGNVGIGTTSPSYKLDVAGNIRVDSTSVAQIFLDSATSNDAVLNFHENASQKGKIGYDTSLGGFGFVAGSGAFSTADMVLLDGGNVGIGTTSPHTKLVVNGHIDISDITNGAFRIYNGSTFRGGWGTADWAGTNFGDSSSDLVAYVNGNNKYFIGTNTQPRLTVDGSGNVGIGTTSPSDKLQVKSEGADDGIALIKSNNTNQIVKLIETGTGDGALIAKNTSNSQQVLIRAEGNSYLNGGNVGIGTTSPAHKLHVNGSVRFQGSLEVAHGVSTSDSAINVGQSRTDNGYAYIDLVGDTTYTDYGLRIIRGNAGANAASDITHRGTGDLGINTVDASALKFKTTNTERMRVTSAGNVGIGTTSPSYKLHVAGTSAFENTMFVYNSSVSNDATSKAEMLSYAVAKFKPSSLNSGTLAFAQVDGGNSIGMQFTNGSGTANWDISMQPFGGNVGIGTTSPAYKLDVAGDIRSSQRLWLSSVDAISISGSDLRVGWSNSNLLFRANSAERMRIDSAGNVGIGTDSPSKKLHISDDNDAPLRVESTDGTTGIEFKDPSGSSSFYYRGDNGHFYIPSGTTFGVGASSATNSSMLRVYSNQTTADESVYGSYFDFNTTGSDTITANRTQAAIYVAADSSTTGGSTASGTEHRFYGIYSDTRASGDSDNIGGIKARAEANATSGQVTNTRGGEFIAVSDGSDSAATHNNVIGSLSAAYAEDAAVLNDLIGGSSYAYVNSNRTTHISALTGHSSEVEINADNTYGKAYLYRGTLDINSTHTITDTYAFRYDISGTSVATNNWGIYIDDVDKNYVSGKLGIGTGSPGENLTISGRVLSYGGTGTVGAGTSYFLGNSNSSRDIALTRVDSGALGIGRYNSGWLETMRFTIDGNVGIGTTSPTNKLDVRGLTRLNALSLRGGTDNYAHLSRFSWRDTNSSSTGTTWKKVCGVSLGSGSYSALSMEVVHYYPGSNHGNSASLSKHYYSISFRRSSGTQDNQDNAVVYGRDANFIRVVRTALGEFELQARANGSHLSYSVDITQTGGNSDAITMVENSSTNGNTTGTIYAAVSSANTVVSLPGSLGAGSNVYLNHSGHSYLNGGNVGIGTTTPDAPLTVHSSTDPEIRFGYSSTQDHRIQWDSSKVYIHADPENANASSALGLYVDGTSRLYIPDSGNVGIGTTSPGYKLEVEGAISAGTANSTSGSLILVGKYSNGNIITIGGGYSAGGAVIGYGVKPSTTAAGAFLSSSALTNLERAAYVQHGSVHQWWTGAYQTVAIDSAATLTQSMTLDGSGNLGIGTTSPSRKLHIVDSVWDNSSGGGVIFENSNTVGASLTLKPSASVVTNGANGWAVYAGGPGAAIGDGNLGFWAHATNDARMVIQRGGNVGIGTSSPASQLHITKSATFAEGAQTNPSGVNAAVVIDYQNNGADTGRIRSRNWDGGTWEDFQIEAKDIKLLPEGKVGIGTTSPASKLDVNGDIAVKGASIINKASAALTIGDIAGTDSITNISLSTADRSTEVFLDDSGNVGINTTTPEANLHVNSSSGVAFKVSPNDTAKEWYIDTTNPDHLKKEGNLNISADPTAAHASTKINFLIDGSNKMRIQDNGNVGISTTSPSYALDVTGTIRATGDVIAYSDARVKENVETIPNALEKVKSMRGVGYNKIGEEKRSVGVIAQELLEVLPEAVHQDEAGMYSVAYGNIVGVLVEAMKEQQQQIDELKAKLDGITK